MENTKYLTYKNEQGHTNGAVTPAHLLLSRAARILKRHGKTDDAYTLFLEESKKYHPPFDSSELDTIWNRAVSCYAVIAQADDYIPPDIYNRTESYRPSDFSDVGQAEMLDKLCHDYLCYTVETGYMYYDKTHWTESEPMAQWCVHDLTRLQLAEAERDMTLAKRAYKKTGAAADTLTSSYRAASMSDKQKQIKADYEDAQRFYKFAVQRRLSKNITATLKEARPMLEIPFSSLDADGFLLNTPSATYDLRKGLSGARAHDPHDYITKTTSVSPGDEGNSIWQAFIRQIFCGDTELIDYIQLVCGLAAIGKVYVEAMIIAVGSGRNGKSTFFNAIAKVLGSYSGNLSADTLTQDCHRNVKPELAEVKGKRLIIAAELKSGTRLSDSVVKQLCSTDQIYAEKKYHNPFAFAPCHTLVLYTNYLPEVSSLDEGIWRRLIVIPFCAIIEGNADIKNYADYLYNNAGPSILSWIIQGAQKVIALNFHLKMPQCVEDAISNYRGNNDWFGHFISDCCVVDPNNAESSALLYKTYREYSEEHNEPVRSTTAFYAALQNAGYSKVMRNRKSLIQGLSLGQN